MTFSKTLKLWRKKSKLKQDYAASILRVPYRTFQEWERGKLPHPDRQQLIEQRIKNYVPDS